MESNKLHKMGRPRTIDRDHVLDMAEKLVTEGGVAALTMDAVAQASGVT
jgi:AcrR family transcriptional regulator